MSFSEYTNDPLWPILYETVCCMILYPHHKAHTRDVILQEKPNVNPQELSLLLGIPLGEAIVILHELLQKESTTA
jgi:hypothetical protein